MSRPVLLALTGLMLVGCASVTMPRPQAKVKIGNALCGREATQIYFGNQDDTLSPAAADVLDSLIPKLNRCARRKVMLVAVSGDDGAPAGEALGANRARIVSDRLINAGLNPARINVATGGRLVEAMPKAPIGGVMIMTQR
jgi:outer membrane protein OmpA-like peptidoglycan-associated protein